MRQAIIASGKHCGVRTCCAPMARRSTRRQLTTEDKNTEETPKHLVLVGVSSRSRTKMDQSLREGSSANDAVNEKCNRFSTE